MADIFISYSKSDHALALKLSAFLEAEGWTVWWDKSLGAADHYRDQIMKQLAAARAVITIWSPNSIKSDWVRAEAGRAKAEGKLIPVKTSELTYADIPLPFGEMHTENVESTDLIRAAIVAQLSKPAITQSPLWQITSTFKYQVLTWIGIIGSAITLFANLSGILDLADWARELVTHWHGWNQMIWGWIFVLIKLPIPREFVPLFSFTAFAVMLVVGVNLSVRTEQKAAKSQNDEKLMEKARLLVLGAVGYIAVLLVPGALLLLLVLFVASLFNVDFHQQSKVISTIASLTLISTWGIGFPIGYLLYCVKDWSRVVINSILFTLMGLCLLYVPLDITLDDPPPAAVMLQFLGVSVLFQILWMAVILFSPLQQLTRRLAFVVLGVLILISLSEISKLNLHQYLKPATVSEISWPTHNLPSHAAA